MFGKSGNILVQLLRITNDVERMWSMPVFKYGSESEHIEGKAFFVDSEVRLFAEIFF